MEKIKELFEEKLTKLIELYEEKTSFKLKRPIITYDLKGKVAGKALRKTNQIKLNIDLVMNEKTRTEMLEQTLGHELAHIIVNQKHRPSSYRILPHGWEWQTAMHNLNLNPEIYHTMETKPARITYKIEYTCGCQTHKITKIKHNKILNGDNYVCRKCNNRLQLKEGAEFFAA